MPAGAMVIQMSREELKALIEDAVEKKLFELLGDPDEGLVLRKAMRNRLLLQRQAVAAGERGQALEDVIKAS